MARRKTYSLARYRAEAKREPFVLEVDEKTSIIINQSSSAALLRVEQAKNSEEALKILTSEQYDALIRTIGDEDAGVLKALVRDLREHFGLGE